MTAELRAERAGTGPGRDFAGWGPSDVVRVAAALRAALERADGLGGAARALARGLRAEFVDEHGEAVLEPVQVFTTGGGSPVLATDAGAAPAFTALAARPEATSRVFHAARAAGDPEVPEQAWIAERGIASVLAFGGPLAGGARFSAVLLSRAPIPAEAAARFPVIATAARAGLLTHPAPGAAEADPLAQRDALREHLALLEETTRDHAAELERAIGRLRAEVDLVDTLQGVGQRLTARLDLDALVQDATDAATRATGAAFGAFFYNLVDQYGESYTLYTLSGAPRDAFAKFPMPRNTAVFEVTFKGMGTVRSDDITRDPRYGRNPPHRGMPAGHLPVCSYLAVPVVSPSSNEVLGGFFFGHPEPGRFTARHEHLAEGIAGYSAIALDNARLFARQRSTATELARSMLPAVPRVPGLEIAWRYLPAAAGSEVGGDWFDVIELSAGRTAFVIGDVVGRGVAAAAVMGQMRTAVRSYAMLDLSPAEVLAHVSRLTGSALNSTFTTCLYAVHDPADRTLTLASAGHLPAVLQHPDGSADLVARGLGMPLGVGESFDQQCVPFPPGARLTLCTDGLVESRTRGLDEGLDALVRGLAKMVGAADVPTACDELIDDLTGGRHDDDIALLHVHHTGR